MRAIAGVGVVLCLAMTSFSIYLGIAEHAFNRHTAYVDFVLPGATGRQLHCLAFQQGSQTATTISAGRPCSTTRHATH